MSNTSNNQGRAYEFIWINILYDVLSVIRPVRIIKNSSYTANQKAWQSLDCTVQETLKKSATAAVKTLLELEPCLTETDEHDLILESQTDGAGKNGDVRDIIVKRDNIKWEIGLSIKHNHDAVKHSRLSHILDFGKEWFGVPCSKNYWKTIQPIFTKLQQQHNENKSWNQLPDKETDVYQPILNAFVQEIKDTYKKDNSISRKMVEYLIGIHDYHKIISHDKKKVTMIKTFNIHGTLNKPSKIHVSIIHVPSVKLPTQLIAIRFKPNTKNIVEMYLNNGWQLSFRIHNARTKIEPSLKFDIQFIGTPASILTIECKW